MDINSINIDTHEYSKLKNWSLSSSSSNKIDFDFDTKVTYPLSFIDAVNKKQLDLETGYFKQPNSNSFNLSLGEAIKLSLLNPKSAYVTDANNSRNFDLAESIRAGLITNNNRVLSSSTSSFTLSLADALKTGHLKIGEHGREASHNTSHSAPNASCSISSETQSMSVRSLKDPSTGEFLVPTEAIKRKLLDPYKGVFMHPISGEQMPISEAIQKGYVIVEMIPQPSTQSISNNNERESNIISTSLIRETKSYHLLGVYDPLRNDEISIKEAIARGILDRQRGLYVHPETSEAFSISDAINKGVIRARILTPPPNGELPYQTLVSTNRFEENRTYTICGAIDPRTHKKISLSQAIQDGIIDGKNGTYVNLVSGEVVSINKAIEAKLVLTEAGGFGAESGKKQPKATNRETKTLNIESVKDLRTGRSVSVDEAMQMGLLDRHSLNYNNPLTNESLSLSKAYEKGYIVGHYSESSGLAQLRFIDRAEKEEKAYFIIDLFDPSSSRQLSLDQAIQTGLFDPSKGCYIHPVSREVISIGDAVRKGLINAQTCDHLSSSSGEIKKYDNRLPVGDFGIDKKIKSMRTKFNKDGTSVLQIDIESTKPTRGIYEVDEIEEFTVKEPKSQSDSSSSSSSSFVRKESSTSSSSEYRQVVDINSVHKVKDETRIVHVQPVVNAYAEKNVLKVEVNKELGLKSAKRIEDIIDDEAVAVVRISVDTKKEIPERKLPKHVEQPSERAQTLIIDDVDDKKRSKVLNIDGQTHVYKKEVQIGEQYQNKIDLLNSTQRSVEELSKQLVELEHERRRQKKVNSAEIFENRAQKTTHVDLGADSQYRKVVTHSFDIKSEEKPVLPRPVYTNEEEEVKLIDRSLYTDTYIVEPPAETVVHQQTTIIEEQELLQDDEDEETFDEWTEVYTITVRGVRYKIIWALDPLRNERVTLREAIKRGIVDLSNNSYHNLKTSHSSTIAECVDDGLVGVEEDTSALTLRVNGIAYTIYWVWDPVKKRRIAPKRAIERGVLDLTRQLYKNYANSETITIHEAVYMKLIGASDDLSSIEEELTLEVGGVVYKIAWVKDSRSGEKYKPRDALRHGLLDLSNYYYNKYATNESLTFPEAISLEFIGISDMRRKAGGGSGESMDEDEDGELNRQDSLLSLDEDELTIRTKTAIYIITGLLHPETQKEIKVSDAIELGILDKENGSYKDFKTNVVYEVGEAINEGIVFATVTDLLQDETASTEFIREEIKRFIVKSVVDPRTQTRIGGLQAQAAGILNYAQGMYTNPDSADHIPIVEAIARNLIEVNLQEETAHEEFDAEVITDTLMERIVTNYRILGVVDPFSNELIPASDAVHRQIIDTETNSYIESTQSEPMPIREAARRNLIKAEISERVERKPFGLTLQNAMRLGLFNPDTGKFKDPYANKTFDLNQAIEKGHINPNGVAVADSTSGLMTLNEAFKYSIFNKRTGVLDRHRLTHMFKGKIVESKIYKWSFEDAVKCGLVSLKTGKYKHQQSGEMLTIREAITRGLIDGESTIIENPLTHTLTTLKQALEVFKLDERVNLVEIETNKVVVNLESAFNTRKLFPAFDENTGEIFLNSRAKIVPFEKAVRKNKLDKSVRIFDPKSNKDLTLNDAIERAIIDKTSGMVIDPKGGGLLSIKEAVKRGILSITGAPVVTGHHNSEAIEAPKITSRKTRHSMQQFDDVSEPNGHERSSRVFSRVSKTNGSTGFSSRARKPIANDTEYLSSEILQRNPGLLSDQSVITNIKVTNEEHRKKIKGNDVIESLKTDYKETVIKPGESPKVTSSGTYGKEFKTKMNEY